MFKSKKSLKKERELKSLVFKEVNGDLPLEKLDELKVYYIGKNGKFTALLKSLKELNKMIKLMQEKL